MTLRNNLSDKKNVVESFANYTKQQIRQSLEGQSIERVHKMIEEVVAIISTEENKLKELDIYLNDPQRCAEIKELKQVENDFAPVRNALLNTMTMFGMKTFNLPPLIVTQYENNVKLHQQLSASLTRAKQIQADLMAIKAEKTNSAATSSETIWKKNANQNLNQKSETASSTNFGGMKKGFLQ